MKIIMTYITLLLSAFSAFGLNRADTVKAYFRVGSSHLDPGYSDNARALQSFDSILIRAMANGAVDSVIVRGCASPEGVSDVNERLSALRSKAVADYILKHSGINPSLIRTQAAGVAWDELRTLVEAAPTVPNRNKVLNIIENVPIWIRGTSGDIVDGRKKRLMDLDNGETYRWLLKNLFPKLRNAVAIAIYYTPEENKEETADVIEISETSQEEEITEFSKPAALTDSTDLSEQPESTDISDTASQSDFLAPSEIQKTSGRGGTFLMAVKTNMLFDALLIPNIGAEFCLGKNLSLYGEWFYAWWDNDSRHRYWRVYGGDLGLRWWFGHRAKENPLSGHHLGIYGGPVIFDFEFGDTGYMGGKPGGTLWDRCLINAGIEYGYSLPISQCLNIDFSIGIGYLGGNYIKYYPFDNDYYQDKEYKLRFFGPTKAEVSLVWLIGNGRAKQRKGGGK